MNIDPVVQGEIFALSCNLEDHEWKCGRLVEPDLLD